MIKVYGFYSCGGYKDMYLGNSEEADTPKYYLPLLPIMKNRNKPEEKEKIEELERLPIIQIITRENRYGFSKECDILFSHGAYSVIYKTLSNGDTCLSIKDIPGIDKDEMGRSIPFNLMFIATGDDSRQLLDNFAIYVKDNYAECISFCNVLFKYDYLSNGIKFDLPAIITKIKEVPENNIKLMHKSNHLVYLMLSSERNVEIAFKEQNLSHINTPCIINTKGEIIKGCLPKEIGGTEVKNNEVGAATEESTQIGVVILKNYNSEVKSNDMPSEKTEEPISVEENKQSPNDRKSPSEVSIIENEKEKKNEFGREEFIELEKRINEVITKIDQLNSANKESYISIKEEIERIRKVNSNNEETNSIGVEWIEKVSKYKDVYYILALLFIIILLLF